MNKTRVFWFAMLSLSLILFLALGEITMRTYYAFRYRHSPLTLDDYLGWRPTENIRFHGVRRDLSGKPYEVSIQTNEHGFGMFGSPGPHPERKRILFVGDSYTHGMQVSNDRTYYGILGRSLPIEVFAIGCSGYGTLQEYLLLDRYLDIIRPDAIVLQFCYNDFINNSYELERMSDTHNNGMRRPYLNLSGEMGYALPGPLPEFRHVANKYSRFLYFLFSTVDRIYRPRLTESSDKMIAEKGKAFPPFKDSIEVTRMILRKMKDRAGPNAPVYVFSVDKISPYHEALMEATAGAGVQFIDGIPDAVHGVEKRDQVTRAEDGMHWNEAGHRIAAEQLMGPLSTYRK